MTLSGTDLQKVARRAAGALDAVSDGYPFTDGLLVYKVSGRVFLVITENPDERLITVKVDPTFAEALVRQHESVHPGRYFDNRHWISVGPGPGITTKLVESLVHDSYDNVVDRLSRQDQDRIGRDFGGR